jgi:outer membrane protein assembly factor BamB
MLLYLLTSIAVATNPVSDDWPMYRADAARSGYTEQSLNASLSLRWTRHERHRPAPAWPTSSRMPYDRAYRVVGAEERLYFGRSSDGQVLAVDALSGKDLWTFQTDGPVRFAPALWNHLLFVAGDDGWLYCLDAADGRLRWKHRGGPRPDMLLGNDRMISRWPARGGPVVAQGVVYYAAGIWPSEGIFVHALDAATGKPLWRNDSSGGLEMDQPHPGARARSGIAAQGHLALTGNTLLVPTGRAVPAALDRTDGALRYFHLQQGRAEGGSEVTAIDGWHFNGGTAFDTATGAATVALSAPISKTAPRPVDMHMAAVPVAAHPRWIVAARGNQLLAFDRTRLVVLKETTDRKGKQAKTQVASPPAWTAELPVPAVAALIVAGDSVVAGAKDRVLVIDAATGRVVWRHAVRGIACDLAVVGGRLFASTDEGCLHCFDRSGVPAIEIRPEPVALPPADAAVAAAADEIVDQSGVPHGYCLDFSCGDGRLTLELARRTSLHIFAVDHDPAMVQAARRRVQAAGLYGVRATVHQAEPSQVSFPDFFADLVVSGRSVSEGASQATAEAVHRMQRPCGGVLCLGRAGAMQRSVRGPLEGMAAWTHQYADAANTLCSGDLWPRSPLAMLWFHDTDQVMPNRHGRGPAPLVADGRMFVEGLNSVRAVSIYNGRTLWDTPLPGVLKPYHQDHLTGVAATGSNLCLGPDRLLLCTADHCDGFDVPSGRRISRWQAPRDAAGQPGKWGYLACDGQTLFGSLANEEHLVKESWRSFLGKLDMTQLLTESRLLFALDARTGEPRWKYPAKDSIRHNAIAAGGGRIYFIDRPLAMGDRPGPMAAKSGPGHLPGELICLDARAGQVLWKQTAEIFGTLLCLSTEHDVLVMAYQNTRFKLDSEVGGRLAAFRASDGGRLWDIEAAYRSRPVIVGQAIYAEPRKWNLLTGEAMTFQFSRSYGCGILAASQRLLVYRSATLGYFDLERGSGTENYGGIRPGCWVNAIPAGGLVLLADAASWCTCSYLNQATVALQPARNDPRQASR